MKKHLSKIVYAVLGSLFGFVLSITGVAQAATQYASGSLLQIGDVQSKHILDGTIVNADVSNSADIDATKVKGGTPAGLVILSNGTKLATSTNFKYATSTNDLYVFGGRINATSTNFGGYPQTWPSSTGTNGQALKTDGSGTLSWGSISSSYLSTNVTAGENLNTGDSVVVATSSQVFTTLASGGSGGSYGFGLSGQNKRAQSFNETTSYCVNNLRFSVAKTGAPVDSLEIDIEGDAGGVPNDTVIASTTITGASLSTSLALYTPTWSSNFCTTASTVYYLVFTRTGSLSGVNYFNFEAGSGASTYANGSAFYFDGATWAGTGTYDVYFDFLGSFVQGRAYRSQASHWGRWKNFIGFAAATTTSGNTAAVITSGEVDGALGVTAGLQYYLSDTLGTLSTTAGTNSRKAAMGIATNTAVVTNQW